MIYDDGFIFRCTFHSTEWRKASFPYLLYRIHCRPEPNVVEEQIKLQIENEWIDIKSKNKNDEIYEWMEKK